MRVLQQPFLLRPAEEDRHHRHELLPRGQVPPRPQWHRVRLHGQVRPQRPAPPRRHHRHAVQEGALQLPGYEGDLPRPAWLQPQLSRGARGIRECGRDRGADGAHADHQRPPYGLLAGHAPLVGLHLADGHQPPAAGAIRHPHHQRHRKDAGGQQCHSGLLAAGPCLLVQPPVLLICLRAYFSDRCRVNHFGVIRTIPIYEDRMILSYY
ncbi:hypothetical protein VPH35_014876 [Triticum aestivum]